MAGLTSHRYWRLNISANNGNGSSVGLTRARFYTQYGVAVPLPANNSSYFSASTTSGPNSNIEPRFVWYNSDPSMYRWNATATTGWVKMDAGTVSGGGIDVYAYDLMINTTWVAADEAPKNWTLEYSDDNTNWTVRDTRINQTGWANNVVRIYRLPLPWQAEKPQDTRAVVTPRRVNQNIAVARLGI